MVNLNLSLVSVSWGNPYWDYFIEGFMYKCTSCRFALLYGPFCRLPKALILNEISLSLIEVILKFGLAGFEGQGWERRRGWWYAAPRIRKVWGEPTILLWIIKISCLCMFKGHFEWIVSADGVSWIRRLYRRGSTLTWWPGSCWPAWNQLWWLNRWSGFSCTYLLLPEPISLVDHYRIAIKRIFCRSSVLPFSRWTASWERRGQVAEWLLPEPRSR